VFEAYVDRKEGVRLVLFLEQFREITTQQAAI